MMRCVLACAGSQSHHPMLLVSLFACQCSNRDGAVQFEEFLTLGRRFPLAFFPLFRFQVELQTATFDQETWLKVRLRVEGMLADAGASAPAS